MMYYTKHKTLADTSETSLFTVPTGYVLWVNYIFIANHGGSTNNVSCWWENSAGVDQLYFLDNNSLQSGNKEILGGQADAPIFVLHNGDVVKAQTGSAGDVEIAFTFKLMNEPAAFPNFNGS